MNELIIAGLRRRKKDILYVVLVTVIVTFFMSGILMTESILESYILEKNRDSYGDWIIASDSSSLSHPYLTEKGSLATGLQLTDEKGDMIGKELGTISEELLRFSRIALYEGEFPDTDGEIAADLQTLQKLGYSYELGQTITIRWFHAEEGVREKSFTLVGTLKPFAALWKKEGRIHYPDLIVTEQDLTALSPVREEWTVSWFYRLDPTLSQVDPLQFAADFPKSFVNEPPKIVINSYTYGSALFGDSDGFIVTGLMVFLAVFAVSFVLSSYSDLRRQAWYRLRTLGCSRLKLDGIIFRECGLFSLPAAALGIGAAYLISAVVCRIIAASVRLHGFFAFRLSVFLIQLAAVFGSILAAILITMIRMRDRRLFQSSRVLTPSDHAKLRKALTRKERPLDDIFSRQRIIGRRRNLIAMLFTVLVVSFLIQCGYSVVGAVGSYISLRNAPDYVIMDRAPEEMALKIQYISPDGEINEELEGTQKMSYFSPYFGPDDADLSWLSSVNGVASVRGSRKDTSHLVSFEGIEKRPDFVRGRYERDGVTYTQLVTETVMPLTVMSDMTLLGELCRKYKKPLTAAEKEAFLGGELIVMTRPEVYTDHWSGEEIDLSALSPQDTDRIRIFSQTNPEGTEVPVKILFMGEFDILTLNNEPYLVRNEIFVSEAVSEALRQAESPVPEFRDNYFEIRFNSFSSYDATDKILASYAVGRPRAEYENRAEQKRFELRTEVVRPLMIYGSLLLMALSVFLIIMRNITEIRAGENLPSCRRIRRLGMTGRKFRMRFFRAEALRNLPILYGFIGGMAVRYLLLLVSLRKSLRPGTSHLIRLTGTWSGNPYLAAFDTILFDKTKLILLAGTVLLYLALILFCSAISRRVYEREEIL